MNKSDTKDVCERISCSSSQQNPEQLRQQVSNSIILKSNTTNKNDIPKLNVSGVLSKSILDYYNLYGQNRDLEQYLRLPIPSQINENVCNYNIPHGNPNFSESTNQIESNVEMNLPSTSKECIEDPTLKETTSPAKNTIKSESQILDKDKSNENKSNKKGKNKPNASNNLTVKTIPEDNSFTAKIEQSQKVNETSKSKTKRREVSFNVESQIEINISNNTNHSANSSEAPVQEVSNMNVLKLEENIKPVIIPQISSNLSPNLDVSLPAVSPTSSVASNKKLEWDSLADVGYSNPNKVLNERPLSTIERIALKRGLKDYRSEIDDVLTTFENMEIGKFDKHKPAQSSSNQPKKQQCSLYENIGAESTTFHGLSLGTPCAKSTPIVKELEIQKDIKVQAEENKIDPATDDKLNEVAPISENIVCDEEENLFKSNETVDTIINMTTNKIEKYVQTSLPKSTYDAKDISKKDKNTSDKIIHLTDKRKSPYKRSINMKKKSPLKQKHKYDINIKKLKYDEEIKTKNLSKDFVYEPDSFKTDRTGDCNDSQYTNADSFEYLPGSEYDKRENTNSKPKEVNLNTSDLPPNIRNVEKVTRETSGLRRSGKINDISKFADTKMSKSTKSKQLDEGKENEQSTLSSRRSKSNQTFDDAHSSTLQHDLQTGIRLLNALATKESGDLNDRKRLVRKVVKRLMEANYPEDSSFGTSDKSRLKDVPDNVVSSRLATNSSTEFSFSTPTSDDSNSKHLSANVPWIPANNNIKLTKSRQNSIINGVDFIRGQIPIQPTDNIIKYKEPKSTGTTTNSSKNISKSSLNSTKSHSTSSNQSLRDWLEPFTRSEKRYERNILSNIQEDVIRKKQEELTTNLIERQQNLFKRNNDIMNRFEKRSVTPDSGLLHYAQKEKEHQLSWINNEIEHLYNLKKLLENQKFDEASSRYSRSGRTDKSNIKGEIEYNSKKKTPKTSAPVHYESVVYAIEQVKTSGVDSTDSSVTRNIKLNIAEANSYNVHNTTIMSSEAKSSELQTPCSECSQWQKSELEETIEEEDLNDNKKCRTSTESNVEEMEEDHKKIAGNKSQNYKIKRKIFDKHGSRRCSQCYCKRMDEQRTSENTSATSGECKVPAPSNKSLNERLKTLTNDIEALKQIVQFHNNKNKSSKDTNQMSAAWDSHVNSSRKYTDMEQIKSRKQRINNNENLVSCTSGSILKTSSTDDSDKTSHLQKKKPQLDHLNACTKSKPVEDNISPVIDNKQSLNKQNENELYVRESYEKVDVSSQTSDTHPSLKSVTLSDKTDEKSTKRTPTPTKESFSIHSSWEIYLDKNIELSKNNKTKSRKGTVGPKRDADINARKQSIESNFEKKELVNKDSISNPKREMRNNAVQTDNGVVKPKLTTKSYPEAVAYLLTFDTASDSIESKESSRKSSLEEIKIKLPVSSKNKKFKRGTTQLKKDSVRINQETTKSSQNSARSHDAEISATSKGNNDMQPSRSHSSMEPENSNANTSELNSVEQATNKSKRKSLQEFLKINKPTFVRKAETRRRTIQEISQLRNKRNSERKRLLTVLDSDRAEGNEDLDEFKRKQGIVMPPVPMTQKRVFTSKEIRQMTYKKYKNLPEVTQKKENRKRENIYRNNRLIAEIFNKKLQRRVLRGQLTLSNSFTVVTELD